MEKLSKPDLKTKSSKAPLVWQSKYEFVAPYDLDECIQRINVLGDKYWDEHLETRGSWFPSEKFGIDSQQDNGGVFNFKISGRASKVMLDAELRGQLIYINDNQTKVKVHVGFKLWSVAFLLVLYPFACALLTFPSLGDSTSGLWVIGPCVLGFLLLIQLWLGYSLKTSLYRDLRQAVMRRKSVSVTE